MKKLFLTFHERIVEDSYNSAAFSMSSKLFLLIMSLILFDICAYGLPGLISYQNGSEKIILISISLFLIFIFVIGIYLRKRIKILHYYCALLLFVYNIIIVEIIRTILLSQIADSVMIILGMISLNFGMNCLIYFNFSWVIFLSANFALYSHIMLRVFTECDWEPEKYLKIVNILILNGGISFYIEYNSRTNYLKLYNSNEFAKTFQHLIDEVLPNPIIIRKVKDFSICFFNKAIVQMLLPFEGSQSKDKIRKSLVEKMQSMKVVGEKEVDELSFNSLLTNFDEELMQNMKKGIQSDLIQKKIVFPITITEIPSPLETQTLNLNTKYEEGEKYFDVKIQKIIWQNEQCFMIILNDISSIISLSKFKDIDVYKNRLLATVSHDLRTPINGMLGMIETVVCDLKEKKNQKLLKMAIKFGHLLLSMINDILDFSKISNCQLSLNFEIIDIVSLIKDVTRLMKFQIKTKGIDFIFEKRNLPEKLMVTTDPNRLKQILLNLLSNALKFTFYGSIKIILQLTMEGLLKISVLDTGIGIKNENIPKLFSLFGKLKQDDPSINKQGIGLGLVISQNLAKLLYNGTNNGINVESTWKKGSEFWFYVASIKIEEFDEFAPDFQKIINPVKDFKIEENFVNVLENSSPRSKKLILSSENIFKKGTILIVDDDQMNLLVAKEYMKFFELDYILAYNGKEALEIIQKRVIYNHQTINAILMDCNMPIMDGFTATKKIQEELKNNHRQPIPIIALTANVSSVDIGFCHQSGMNFYLSKPVSRRELANILSTIMKTEFPV